MKTSKPLTWLGGWKRNAMAWDALQTAHVSVAIFFIGLLNGCGVTPKLSVSTPVRSLNIVASNTTLIPRQSTTLTVTATGIPVSSVSLNVQCEASQCGTVQGNQFTAPSSIPAQMSVTITASSSVNAVSPATITLQLVPPPPPSIGSITPISVAAGVTQPVTLTGSGFSDDSSVLVTDALNGTPVTTIDQHTVSSTDMSFTITAPDHAGVLQIRVQNHSSTLSVSNSVELNVISTPATSAQPIPAFDANTYFASGSPRIYSCSGKAGSYQIICNQSALDFIPGEGIRIVSAGPVEGNPASSGQPVITKRGALGGSHTYCYVVFVGDALGGISAPSPQACISNEPDLSFRGTYNIVQGSYAYPLSPFLWYVSEDDGPFQLFSVSSSHSTNGEAQDVGQRLDSRGGWPSSFAVGSQDLLSKNQDLFSKVVAVSGNQITLQDPLPSSVVNAEVDHDDTGAIQDAINAAVSVGGGVVALGDGTFNMRRPIFPCRAIDASCPTGRTLNFKLKPSYDGYSNLYLDYRSSGNIYLKGNGASTVIQTPPDAAGYGDFIAMGGGVPANAPYVAIKIEDADKGATSVTLASDNGLGTLHPGDDVWLYTGSFGGPGCVDSNGSPGGNCHFSEINTITSIRGRVLSLAYPTSKRYYDDGVDSFGLVKMPITPHNVGLSNFTINTYNPVTGVGMLFGLTVNHVTVNGFTSHGAFEGGMKRDMLVENSSWGIGAGDASWTGTEELDQCTGVSFLNDTITGYSAPTAEGPSLGARIYLTEGTSQVFFEHNKFDHVAILSQDTTDDVIDNNVFNDATVSIGHSYNGFGHPLFWGYAQDFGFISFGSQVAAQITNNVFNIDSGYTPPWIISLGHFTSGIIDNNIILDDSPSWLATINSDGGEIEDNQITIGTNSALSWGIAAIPDEGPGIDPSAFVIQRNVINATKVSAGIYVVNSGFTDAAPVCIRENVIKIQYGQTEQVGPSTADLSCSGIEP